MYWMLRFAALTSFLVALVAVGLFACPSLATDVTGLWYVMDDQARIRSAEELNSRMDRETELAQWRIASRLETVRDVLAGRTSAETAAERFVVLNRAHAPTLAYIRARFPGRTDFESAGLQLANYLRTSHDPAGQTLADAWERRLSELVAVTDRTATSE
jgi:hypothetical protein